MNTFQAYLVGVLLGAIVGAFLCFLALDCFGKCEPCTTDQCRDKIEQEQKAINFNTFG